MHYVLLAISCSVLVSVLLKLAKRYQVDIGQAIAWNYLAATGLTLWLLQPSLQPIQQSTAPWLTWLALGGLLPTIFLAMAAYVIGTMYSYGRGVAQDKSQADIWLNKACGNGNGNGNAVQMRCNP